MKITEKLWGGLFMLRRFTDLCVRYVQRFMPDPFLFAVLLSFIVVILDFIFVKDASIKHP
jgi:short-chain fatty acids transporter